MSSFGVGSPPSPWERQQYPNTASMYASGQIPTMPQGAGGAPASWGTPPGGPQSASSIFGQYPNAPNYTPDYYRQGLAAYTNSQLAGVNQQYGAQAALNTLGYNANQAQSQFNYNSTRADLMHQLQTNQLQAATNAADRARNALNPGFIQRNYANDLAQGQRFIEHGLIEQAQAQTGYQADVRNLYSGATAKGSISTEGVRQQYGTLGQQLAQGLGLGKVTIERGQNLQTQAGITRDMSMADYNQASARLNQLAAQSGVDAGYLTQQLNLAAQKLGLDKSQNALTVMKDMNSTNIDQATAANKVYQLANAMAQQPGGYGMFAGAGLQQQLQPRPY